MLYVICYNLYIELRDLYRQGMPCLLLYFMGQRLCCKKKFNLSFICVKTDRFGFLRLFNKIV